MDLVIRNGCIVSPQGRYYGDIEVVQGKISAIHASGSINPENAKEVIEAQGLFILPGCIDAHVHFRDPGHTYKEDFITGSAAAAAGGVTMVFDMPNNNPRVVGKTEFAQKTQMIAGRSYVDYAFFGTVKEDNLDKLSELVEAGARAFKAMMGVSAMRTPTVKDATLRYALSILKNTGCPIFVHAENTEIVQFEIERLKKEGRTDYRAHMESRPVVAEAEAIQRAITFAEDVGGKLHIAHIAAGVSVEIIRAAKKRGVDVTTETGPHNLILSDKDYEKIGPAMFMNPPVRTLADQEALWEGLRDGTVDMVSTDHSPHSEEEKYRGGGVWESISGCLGVETNVPIMLTQINERKLTLEKYVEVSSVNGAKLFRLYPQKGCIQVGSDADFTIVDMNRKGIIKRKNLKSKTKVTPFDGLAVKGMPVYTVVRGRIVMKNGEVSPTMEGKLF